MFIIISDLFVLLEGILAKPHGHKLVLECLIADVGSIDGETGTERVQWLVVARDWVHALAEQIDW